MKNNRILIVEDEPHIAEVIAMQMRFAGLEPVLAQDAREALVVVGSEPVGVLIADVALPGLSGVDLAHVFARDPRHRATPIILLTGTVQGVAPAAIEGTQVVAVMQKPFSPRELQAKVAEVLRERQPPEAIAAPVQATVGGGSAGETLKAAAA